MLYGENQTEFNDNESDEEGKGNLLHNKKNTRVRDEYNKSFYFGDHRSILNNKI